MQWKSKLKARSKFFSDNSVGIASLVFFELIQLNQSFLASSYFETGFDLAMGSDLVLVHVFDLISEL